jgi:hypothetical protein
MAIIDDAIAQGIFDRVAYIEKNLAAAIDGGTVFYDRVTTSEDPSVELPLGLAAHNVDLAIASGAFYSNLQSELLNGFLQHLQRQPESGETKEVYTTLDDYLAAVEWRVAIQVSELHNRTIGARLAVANVYDDVVEMGAYNVTGSGSGTWVDGLGLSAYTGGNNLEAYIPEGKAATDVLLNVTCKKPDTTTEVKQITVDGEAGDTVDIGDGGDIYIDITLVAIVSGGENGEQVKFRSKLDRPMAL